SVNSENIEVILNKVFKDTDVQYMIDDRQVFLFKKDQIISSPPANPEPFIVQQPTTKVITGTVKDEKGFPLSMVSVAVKGIALGTISDINGNFRLEVPIEAQTLVLSFVGMKTQEVDISDRLVINVVMAEDLVDIAEVVAIGYGTVKKSDLTGAVSSIKADDLSLSTSSNITQSIQGKASGVMIRQLSAQPGGGVKILIRGEASTGAGNEPLYVIDGFPISNTVVEPEGGDRYLYGSRNPLNSINPNDIESIEILKDASATAIYGARAANGVVLITTKRARQGLSINYKGSYSLQNIPRYIDMLNAEEYMTFYNRNTYEKWLENNSVYPYGSTDPSGLEPFTPRFSQAQISTAGEGTDWFDEVTRQGTIAEHNLSISGGNEKTRVFSSFNYFNQKGVILNSEFKRYSGRFNIDQKITEKISAGINITASEINNLNSQLGGSEWQNSGIIGAAIGFPPIYPVYDSEGNYSVNELYPLVPNPVSYQEISDRTITNRVLANPFIEFELFKDLNLRANFGADYQIADRSAYLPKTFLCGSTAGGKASKSMGSSKDYLSDIVLTYTKSFNELHNITALAGYSYQQFNKDGFSSVASNFFTDAFLSNQLQAGSDQPITNSYKESTILASYFSRVNYSFDSKYLISVNARVDGSDRFGANNKYAFFPSIALGWNISKEDFMGSFGDNNSLKIRASLGQTGNSNIGGNAFAFYAANTRTQFDDKIVPGVRKVQLENPDLKWETTTEYNLGIDFGIMNNRISGSLEYFRKTISDLLFQQTLQSYMEVSSIFMNVGSTRSEGVEFQLNGRILTGDFRWSADLNFSRYNDRWKERAPSAIKQLSPWIPVEDNIRSVYYFKADGIAQPGQTIAHMPLARPGNLILQDLNGFKLDGEGNYVLDENGRRVLIGSPDGKIDDADRILLGNADPKLIAGFGNNFEYKGFDLNIFFYGMFNYVVYDQQFRKYTQRVDFLKDGWNMSKNLYDVWYHDNLDGIYPGTSSSAYSGSDAQAYQEISFLRLKNVTLGYKLPKKVAGTSLRLFIEGTNLLTLTNYDGIDPEADGQNEYPMQRSYT
ncbi:MAG: TonB-dependent receptor, partial [Bacteroidales bacterium]|nr:TonB-dependent receptor [Bacteroidales bacterium]